MTTAVSLAMVLLAAAAMAAGSAAAMAIGAGWALLLARLDNRLATQAGARWQWARTFGGAAALLLVTALITPGGTA